MSRTPALRRLLLLLLCCASFAAHAGAIFFSMTVNGNRLQLTNLGNSSAFYPQVLRLVADGTWEPLPMPAGRPVLAELPSNGQMEWQWPALTPIQRAHPFADMQPVMVRFFDQAGSSFGQISFFKQPPQTEAPLESSYQGGRMIIASPPQPRAAWLLWAQEEGITPLQSVVPFSHQQPPARHLTWKGGDSPLSLDLGAGQPSAILLHETPQGFTLQILGSGGLQGRQQRHAWLDATPGFYKLAIACMVLSALLLGLHLRQRRPATEAAQ